MESAGDAVWRACAQGVSSALPAVEASPLQIRGAKWYMPNQIHMYMEPQTTVAKWDEGGNIQARPSPLLCACPRSDTADVPSHAL